MSEPNFEAYMTTEITPLSSYCYARGRDGCDETFDIISLKTRQVVASIHFWEQAERAEAEARRLIDALNAIADIQPYLHIEAFLRDHREIAIVWNTEDVQHECPRLNHDQCWEVLKHCREAYDRRIGMNAGMIRAAADMIFPEHAKGGDQ